jgi:hypothetical protein
LHTLTLSARMFPIDCILCATFWELTLQSAFNHKLSNI